MQLSPEDAKLVTLARSSRARTGAEHGAAVRDQDGRTYVASTVVLPSVQFAALDLAVAMAVSSGATGLEAGALVGDLTADADVDPAAVRDVAGSGISVHLADAQGTVVAVATT